MAIQRVIHGVNSRKRLLALFAIVVASLATTIALAAPPEKNGIDPSVCEGCIAEVAAVVAAELHLQAAEEALVEAQEALMDCEMENGQKKTDYGPSVLAGK